MNNKAGFAFHQFVDLPYNWAYNGSALVNTVLRTTDNNTDPVRRLFRTPCDTFPALKYMPSGWSLGHLIVCPLTCKRPQSLVEGGQSNFLV